MKQLLLLVPTLFFTFDLFAQINQNNWFIGGCGNYSTVKYSLIQPSYLKIQTVQISFDAGYFLIDKLAAGVRITYLLDKSQGLTTDSSFFMETNREIDFTPFIRYYFLPIDQKFNLLLDGGYNFSGLKNKIAGGNSNTIRNSYSFSAGPVFFISSDAALELTLNYQSAKDYFKSSPIKINIGFQIYIDDN